MENITDNQGNPLLRVRYYTTWGYIRKTGPNHVQFASKPEDFDGSIGYSDVPLEAEGVLDNMDMDPRPWVASQGDDIYDVHGSKIKAFIYEDEARFCRVIDSTHVTMARLIPALGTSFTVYHINEIPEEIQKEVREYALLVSREL